MAGKKSAALAVAAYLYSCHSPEEPLLRPNAVYSPLRSTGGNVTDMDRSGDTIAYDYFKEKIFGDKNSSRNDAIAEFHKVRRLFKYND